jgi:molybdopterin molybdotransferase
MGLFSAGTETDDADAPRVYTHPGLPKPPATDDLGMRTVEQHCDYILSMVTSEVPIGVKLQDAWGLTICETIKAEADLPADAIAEVDGYAVRASETQFANADQEAVGQQVTLKLVAREPILVKGTCVVVQAGDALPLSADAVVPQEFAELRLDGDVALYTVAKPGEWVRDIGSDTSHGEILVANGQVVSSRLSALLAAAGYDRVLVRPQARVAVLSFVTAATDPIDSADRRGRHLGRADSYLLSGVLRADGARVWRTEIVAHKKEWIRDAIENELVRADIIIAPGGLGVPAVREVLRDVAQSDFAEVAMEPAGDQAFGLVGDQKIPMFLLPADPFSALVSYLAFVRPALRKRMGTLPHKEAPVECLAGSNIISDPEVTEFVFGRVSTDGSQRTVELSAPKRQFSLGDLVDCNAIVALPQGPELIHAGDPLQCWLLD